MSEPLAPDCLTYHPGQRVAPSGPLAWVAARRAARGLLTRWRPPLHSSAGVTSVWWDATLPGALPRPALAPRRRVCYSDGMERQ